MERKFSNMLDDLFGEISPMINMVAGIVALIVGIGLLVSAKKQSSKGKNTAGWICIGVGCIAILSGVVQLSFR